jgi:hypothetical protein
MTLRSGVTALLTCGALIGTAAPAQAVQVPDAHCDEWAQFTSGVSAWAQTFTAEHSGPLTKARFYIATDSVVSLEVSIHAVDGSGLPTGPALATTTLSDIPARPSMSFTPLADNFVDASFASAAQVTAGQFYALAVKIVAGTEFSILQSSTSDPCAGTAFKDEDVNGTWEVYESNDIDLTMAVFVGDPETTTPPPSGGGGPPAAPPKPPVPPKPPPIVSIRGTSLFFLNGQTCQVVTQVDAAGTVTVRVLGNVPGAKASKKKKKKLYPIGTKTVRTTKAGKVKLNVPISKAARKAIADKGKLKATMEVTFTPAGGGKATTKKKSITLKPKPKPKKKR